jgi:hypothetical protein
MSPRTERDVLVSHGGHSAELCLHVAPPPKQRSDRNMPTAEQLASQARFAHEMSTIDATVDLLLKGHLLIEEALAATIDLHIYEREHLAKARLSFSHKLHVARALALRKAACGEWELMLAINALRNEVAHQLRSAKREEKMASVRALYRREASGLETLPETEADGDASIIVAACAHCCGF